MGIGDIERLRRDIGNLFAERKSVLERFLSEAEFAAGLSRLYPSRAGRWGRLIERACGLVGEAIASGKSDRIGRAVNSAEEVLAPIGKTAKRYTIHCVGHAHIDMNWQWSWPETVAVTNDTFITVLKLMDEFPDFCFSQSQASVYEIARDHNPELFDQIRRRVAEGRWEVTAAHWVEGDKNLASGESLARHLLYTRRFFAEHFGLEPQDVPIDWEPDTFGHACTIPTIVAAGGVTRYYLCRGGRGERPAVFWWRGPDGSRVLVYLDRSWYNDHIGPHNVKTMLDFCEQTGLTDWMCVYGVGDHGGGPTRRDLARCGELNRWPIFPNFRFSTTGQYYSILEKRGDELPVFDGELNFEFTGCYSSQSAIKQANRLAENQLEEAEAAAVLAHRIVGRHYPDDDLREAWINTLFGHFHDILPGSGVRATREYQLGLLQKTLATTGMVKTHSLRAMAEAVDTSFSGDQDACTCPLGSGSRAFGAGVGRGAWLGEISSASHAADGWRAFVVFNPTTWKRTEVVTVSVWDFDSSGEDGDERDFVVRLPDGRVIPAQVISKGHYWGHDYVDLAFPVSVGPLGYYACVIERGKAEGFDRGVWSSSTFSGDAGERRFVGGCGMENEHLSVAFDKLTGGIISLVDKGTGRDLADGSQPMGVLEYVLERAGAMSAWVIGDTQRCVCPLELESFGPGLSGPNVASVVAKLKVNESTISVTYTLRADEPWLEIDVSAMWVERGGSEVGTPSLRMRFPLALSNARGRYEVPFGSIERDLNCGEEVPSLRWADVSGKVLGTNATAGCTLVNDCKYGHSLDGSTLRLTLIRSSYEPDRLPEIGEHTIRMGLIPRGGRAAVADLSRLGASFNHRLEVVSTDIHKGTLPARGAAIMSVRPANVIVSCVKKTEKEDALMFRLFETDGKAATAKVRLDDALLGKVTEVVEADLLERPVKNSTAVVTRDGFGVEVKAHGITTVKAALEK